MKNKDKIILGDAQVMFSNAALIILLSLSKLFIIFYISLYVYTWIAFPVRMSLVVPRSIKSV